MWLECEGVCCVCFLWFSAQAKAGGEEGAGEGAGEGEGEGEGESDSSPPEPTHWCALCCQDGSLKVLIALLTVCVKSAL